MQRRKRTFGGDESSSERRVGITGNRSLVAESAAGIEWARASQADVGPFYQAGMTIGPDGNIWFLETSAHNIARITPVGTLTEFTLAGISGSEVVTGSDGNFWFSENSNYAVVGLPINGVTTEPDGNIWLVASSNKRIIKATPTGTTTAYSAGLGASPLVGYIKAGPDGNL